MTLRALLTLSALLVAIAPAASAAEIVDFQWDVSGVDLHLAVGEHALVEAQTWRGDDVVLTPEQAESAASEASEPAAGEPAYVPPPPIIVDFPEPIDLTRVASVARVVPGLAPAARPAAGSAAPVPAPAASPAAPSPPASPPEAQAALAPATVTVAAMATVAAVGAAGPAFSLPWDRLKRLLVFVGLYTRIARERLLDHEARERLLEGIRARPGLPLGEAARAASLPRNTAVYHLRRLEKEGLVSSVRKGRARLYFAPGSLDKLPRADGVAALRHPKTAELATKVGATPGMDQQALCRHLNIAPSLAHWHATRLVDAGIVRRERDGRHVRYYPGPAFDLVNARPA